MKFSLRRAVAPVFFSAGVMGFATADSPPMKSAPTRPAVEANVIIDRMEILDECADDKICVQGTLLNNGAKPAYRVWIRIDIGGTQQGRPRAVLTEKPAQPTLAPAASDDFSFKIPRQVSYRRNGKEKTIEVGRYNFHLVPMWAPTEKPPAPAKHKTGKALH